jgi:cytochrome c oxidase subunit 4
MAHAHNDHATEITVLPPDKEKIKKIWMTALILAVVTGIEFIAAFTINKGIPLTSLFVVLTFVKTFYIVGEFMHLKYEVKLLIWCIVLPVAFICWFIGAMLTEGHSVEILRTWVETWFTK